MSERGSDVSRNRWGGSRTWPRIVLLALVVIATTLIAASVSADGAVQISGEAILDGSGAPCERDEFPDGFQPDYGIPILGDLEGCVYVRIEDFSCSPSGTYRETGTEFYDIIGGDLDKAGTFFSEYRFTGKFEQCPPDLDTLEIFGRCQHPMVTGSGTDDFEGASGRLDYKDFPEENYFPYRGHLRW